MYRMTHNDLQDIYYFEPCTTPVWVRYGKVPRLNMLYIWMRRRVLQVVGTGGGKKCGGWCHCGQWEKNQIKCLRPKEQMKNNNCSIKTPTVNVLTEQQQQQQQRNPNRTHKRKTRIHNTYCKERETRKGSSDEYHLYGRLDTIYIKKTALFLHPSDSALPFDLPSSLQQ